MKYNHIHVKAPKGYIYNELGALLNCEYVIAQMKKADAGLFAAISKDLDTATHLQDIFCEFSDRYDDRHGGTEFALNKISQD